MHLQHSIPRGRRLLWRLKVLGGWPWGVESKGPVASYVTAKVEVKWRSSRETNKIRAMLKGVTVTLGPYITCVYVYLDIKS
jgi:hypothetical protein